MQALNHFSQTRLAWLSLLLFMVFFEACALAFQHVMELPPCVMCIYERVAMLGIAGGAIIGLLKPNNLLVRILGFAAWGVSAAWGLQLSITHTDLQMNPSPFATCDLFVSFPGWAPLDQWLPWMFQAYGSCDVVDWIFLSLSMPQWLIIIFAANLIALVVMVMAQFFTKPALV
ncbi:MULTISPECIES: disulfide bond formation protein DsbB [unclassified Agarivorans]|uniref:disulfide bond formation protein DsbB n=1 Tax=unclassified Agarivorans TaxID=2636026 RepID=UPI0026E47FC8|nr:MULTISPECIES: disulfide bond formation protein DsbB [unclassified Agarivorans]MDO6683910.1 disulfide bond formation protein DsbB [Agarivorans sp. 3_MG-2023]MDO6714357.1 disulfide bond formation protein DsbB [Agarivorans sp. 2_MG-2023]MDO6762411.1 disulfide bond formation protein DsbB [Agarivorans sp. 1_MG-2023]